jgi:hypothetical protein
MDVWRWSLYCKRQKWLLIVTLFPFINLLLFRLEFLDSLNNSFLSPRFITVYTHTQPQGIASVETVYTPLKVDCSLLFMRELLSWIIHPEVISWACKTSTVHRNICYRNEQVSLVLHYFWLYFLRIFYFSHNDVCSATFILLDLINKKLVSTNYEHFYFGIFTSCMFQTKVIYFVDYFVGKPKKS